MVTTYRKSSALVLRKGIGALQIFCLMDDGMIGSIRWAIPVLSASYFLS